VDEAIAFFEKALAIRPDHADTHYNLGTALLQKGRMDEAIARYQKALEIQPVVPEVHNNLRRLAWVLATCPETSGRSGVKALKLAQQLDRLSGGSNPMVAGTLAAAYAETGRFPEAVAAAQRALRLAVAQQNTGLVDGLQEQIRFYQSGFPFRDTGPMKVPAHPDQP
jgi:Flp pilus assembly protein TadD